MKFREIQVEPKSRTFDPQQLISDLRKRVAVARNSIMSQNSGKIAKVYSFHFKVILEFGMI